MPGVIRIRLAEHNTLYLIPRPGDASPPGRGCAQPTYFINARLEIVLDYLIIDLCLLGRMGSSVAKQNDRMTSPLQYLREASSFGML